MTFRFHFIIFLIFSCTLSTFSTTCHYTCSTCSDSQYYQCLTCPSNRGTSSGNSPIAGMCYCTDQTDEDVNGVCTGDYQFNRNNKSIIGVFIGLAILFTLFGALLTGQRHFLVKTLQDVQEISIIVFINLYFPQQFDIFLTYLYRFNISSYTFLKLASGLFVFDSNKIISSTDGQNIYGKYKLLYKTANFFSNQFTWIIVFACLVIGAVAIKIIRMVLKKSLKQNKRQNLAQTSFPNSFAANATINQFHETKGDFMNSQVQVQQSKSTQNNQKSRKSCIYGYINKIHNFVWLNFFITFFYLSLIQINVNVFTQISNLTFSSSFAAAGAFFSALFLALQIVILALLALKIREQTIKPQWMRDYTYTAAIHMIRTNYKTVTKYFWFFSCIKKIFLGMMITIFYYDPSSAILGISIVQIVYICISLYCEPFDRRYIRIHFYAMQGIKLFIYVCLINFTEQYVEYAKMIELTKILYFMMAFYFGFNFFYIVLNMIAQKDIYVRFWLKRFYPDSQSPYKEGKMGYHSEGRLFIYEKQ